MLAAAQFSGLEACPAEAAPSDQVPAPVADSLLASVQVRAAVHRPNE